MRRWSFIVALTASLVLGTAACGLKESDDAGDFSLPSDATDVPDPGLAAPPTDAPSTDDTTGDDPFGDPGSGEDPFGDGGSGDDGSGDGGSGEDDFCSLAKESPDPTSTAAGDEFFQRWRETAPEELHDEIDVVTDWYEDSKSDPTAQMPEEVLDALIAIGQYTVANCT